jgi:hypothetical protein
MWFAIISNSSPESAVGEGRGGNFLVVQYSRLLLPQFHLDSKDLIPSE